MMLYIINLILCSGLLFMVYSLWLGKEKMHHFNRLYLLFSLVLPFIIPLLTFTTAAPVLSESVIVNQVTVVFDGAITPAPVAIATPVVDLWPFILPSVYIVVALVLLFRYLFNIRRLLTMAARYPVVAYKGSSIVLLNDNVIPHSFLHYIFLSADDFNNGKIEEEVLLHELTHIRQRHSLDLLLLEFIQVICWFNPFLFFYRRAIALNHEFLADGAVISTSRNTHSYQYLLINRAGQKNSPGLTSRFNYLITKKRLLMMTKATSPATAFFKKLAILPLLALAVFLFSAKMNAQQVPDVVNAKQADVPSTPEGVSAALLAEYEQIVSKVIDAKGNIAGRKFSDAERERLETIFLQMSREQQAKQTVIFMPPARPLPRLVPTKEQLSSWKDGTIYGVWVNGKRINNAELSKYSNTDFAQMMVSKLGKNTVNYGKHYYQVDLMTTTYYDNYYKQAISNKKYMMGFRMGKKQEKVVEKWQTALQAFPLPWPVTPKKPDPSKPGEGC